jgi:acyl carrier protein
MWMTDHIARVRADGCIEVLGNAEAEARLDQAAAARARAEAALRGLPGVADAALCVLQDGVVAGFVAPHPGVELAPAVLRDRLFTELPRHIAPAEIWVLAALPRDAGGGVDRAALRDQATPRAARVRRPPATPSERGLAAIWRDLLQREEIWAEHSFFALGGHSLSAIRLVHRVDQDLGVRLPLRAVFEFPLLSDLARRIDGIAADAATLPAIEAPIRVLPRPATWRGVVEPAGPE